MIPFSNFVTLHSAGGADHTEMVPPGEDALAFKKRGNQQISDVVGLNPKQVTIWRRRWKSNSEKLIATGRLTDGATQLVE